MGSKPIYPRGAWLRTLADQVLEGVDGALTWPAEALTRAGRPADAAATILTGIAARHEAGELLDRVLPWLQSPGLLADPDSAFAVATRSIDRYRRGRLPGSDWWDATNLHVALLVSWARSSADDLSEADLVELVATNFGRKAAAEIVAMARAEEPRPLDDLIVEWAARDERLARLVERADALSAGKIASLPEFAQTNADLISFARAVTVFALARAVVSEQAQSVVDDGAQVISDFGDAMKDGLEAWFAPLTPLEVSLVHGSSDSDPLLLHAVSVTRKRLLIVELTPNEGSPHAPFVIINGLPDRFDGVSFETDWLRNEVFSGGARSGLFEWGPTAYGWIAFEQHELDADRTIDRVGLGLAKGSPGVIVAQLKIDDGDPVQMDYYVGHHEATLRWLAMLVLSGRIMFDVFRIEGSDLKLVTRVSAQVRELAEELRNFTRARIEVSEEMTHARFPRLDDHVVGGFFASENAKSEFLLQLGRDEASDEGLLHARKQLLDAEVARVLLLYDGQDPSHAESAVEGAKRDYLQARQSQAASRPDSHDHLASPDGVANLARMTADLASDGRVLVHYNARGGYIEGFWVANEGADRGWLGAESMDVAALERAVEPWLHGPRADARDVATLLAVAEPFGRELDSALSSVGAREAVIFPWSLLHAVPFGALALDGGTFGEKYTVSYAPSAALLRNVATGQRLDCDGVELVAAHDGDLPWASAEIAAAASIHPGAEVVPESAALENVIEAMSRGRIIHVAAHGSWWSGDHFASALRLADRGGTGQYLTAATVHRDVDLRGAELVLLAACDSGRGPARGRGIELYTGLDGAFIAQGARAVISTMWPVSDFASFLFMTNVHVQIRSGQTLATAFEQSVGLLRGGGYQAIAEGGALDVALSAGDPDWRGYVERIGDHLTDSYFWAPYRLSGAHWASHPV